LADPTRLAYLVYQRTVRPSIPSRALAFVLASVSVDKRDNPSMPA
jgi:hypothetical protein